MPHLIVLFTSLILAAGVDTARTLDLAVRPLPIQERTAGQLEFRAALQLIAIDPAFGGFSGMLISADGRSLSAITDRGNWLTATLDHDKTGALQQIHDAQLGPLGNREGQPISDVKQRDAEELLLLADPEQPPQWLVSFEGEHRLWRYALEGTPAAPQGKPLPLPAPSGITETAANSGMEALARLDDGRLVVFTEGLETDDGGLRAWVGQADGSAWQPMTLTSTGTFQPTGAATLPNGDILLLERSYSPLTGVRARLSVIGGNQIRPQAVLTTTELARLLPRHNVDNMEAVATRAEADGAIAIYLLADDNFRSQQRTVLLQLRWRPTTSP